MLRFYENKQFIVIIAEINKQKLAIFRFPPFLIYDIDL